MSGPLIKIGSSKVRWALAHWESLRAANRAQLMQIVGLGQLKSIYLTFAEEGSPAGSWPRLALSTIEKLGKRAAGHKLLIGRGALRNSIRVQSDQNRAVIGTGLVYAAVHQFGSRDRGTAIGPRTEKESKATVTVKAHSFTLKPKLEGRDRYQTKEGPAPEGKQRPRVRYSLVGPLNLSKQTLRSGGRRESKSVTVKAHDRHQNIPARPYLVFRPEDPARIEEQVRLFNVEQARAAGLEVK